MFRGGTPISGAFEPMKKKLALACPPSRPDVVLPDEPDPAIGSSGKVDSPNPQPGRAGCLLSRSVRAPLVVVSPGGSRYAPVAGFSAGDHVDHGEITQLLRAHGDGDREALTALFELVYKQLRGMSRRQLFHGGRDNTLDTTALVHEAYIKLVDQNIDWADRRHFFAVAAKAMRHILVDYAKARRRDKRGGGTEPEVFMESIHGELAGTDQIVELDLALQKLEQLDPRLAEVVQYRFFAGLSVEETARVLGVTDRTVKRDWRKARALLQLQMGSGAGEGPDRPAPGG